jgi:hypothetical protein
VFATLPRERKVLIHLLIVREFVGADKLVVSSVSAVVALLRQDLVITANAAIGLVTAGHAPAADP